MWFKPGAGPDGRQCTDIVGRDLVALLKSRRPMFNDMYVGTT